MRNAKRGKMPLSSFAISLDGCVTKLYPTISSWSRIKHTFFRLSASSNLTLNSTSIISHIHLTSFHNKDQLTTQTMDLLQVSSPDLSKKTRESERGKIKMRLKRRRRKEEEKNSKDVINYISPSSSFYFFSHFYFPSLFLFSLARFLEFFFERSEDETCSKSTQTTILQLLQSIAPFYIISNHVQSTITSMLLHS